MGENVIRMCVKRIESAGEYRESLSARLPAGNQAAGIRITETALLPSQPFSVTMIAVDSDSSRLLVRGKAALRHTSGAPFYSKDFAMFIRRSLKTIAFAGTIAIMMLVFSAVSNADDNLDPTIGETAWGNYVADSMREFYKCDIAVIDAGTLATLTQKEAISETETRLDIAEVEVVKVTLTGSELAVVLNNAVKFYPRKNNGFLQISGMTVSVNPALRQDKVTSVTVNGAPLKAEKVYVVAATKFLANGGASFGILEDINVIDGSTKFVGDLIAAYYGANPNMPAVGTRYVVEEE